MPTPKKSKTVYDGLRRAFGYCETCTENFRVASEGEETEDVCEACIHSLQMHCGRKIITLECFKQMVKFMKPDRLPWVIERVGVYRWHPSHLDKKYLYGMKRGVTQKKYKGVDCKDFKSHSCKSVAPAFEPTLPAEEIEEEDELDVELFVEENVAEEPPLMRRRLEENLNDKDSDDSDFDLDDESYEESEDFSESSDSEPDPMARYRYHMSCRERTFFLLMKVAMGPRFNSQSDLMMRAIRWYVHDIPFDEPLERSMEDIEDELVFNSSLSQCEYFNFKACCRREERSVYWSQWLQNDS
eukprot:TRINITY_DN298_c0_g1_i1.p1 TRINITY_DN298_c0_g1~~TRINITY_DN298_c0_g1_i1.p1  ORF type:complete len:299 (+),score=57.14 TRINITY_DN298_c0_g1_i1:342-1238(+)